MKIANIVISHPNKLLYLQSQISKQAVATYYKKIAPLMLPYLKNRPITLKRYPNGIDESGFFVKRAQDYYPDFIQKITVPRHGSSDNIRMIGVNADEDLVYLAGQDVLEFHMPLSTTDDFNQPDQLIFDFDPSDNDFNKVRQAAFILKKLLDEHQLPSFVKTTGSRGVHVHIPIKKTISFDKAKLFSRSLAKAVYQQCPDITTLEHRKEKRGNKVFIDYLRNDFSMTAVAAFSLRALENAPVATPIDWEELHKKNLTPQSYHLHNILKRTAQKTCPWQAFFQSAVDISNHNIIRQS